MDNQKLLYFSLLSVCIVSLSACGGGNHDDLEQYIESVKQQPKTDIPPIPDVKAYQPFEYPEHDRDPFDASVIAAQLTPQNQPKGSVTIDQSRPREYLERFPLDSLRMVGTLNQHSQLWALVRTPDGTIQRVQVGNYIGQNFGRISRISDSGIELIEAAPNGLGGYTERAAKLALSEQ